MKKGFTLIEMTIVVVVIGVLAASLLPKLTSGMTKAENAGAIKDVRDIITALEMYKIDNDNIYPVSVSCNGTVKTDCSLSGVYTQLSPYLRSIPKGNTKLAQWIIGNGNIVPAGNAYGYIGTGQRYILSYQFVDTRDGQRYKTVRMPDEKRWMAENLNYKTVNSVCYDNIETNCANGFGRLYNWDEAQTACPVGWRLPTDDEWTIILNKAEELYGGTQTHKYMNRVGSLAGRQFTKAQTDSFGMSILLGGCINGSSGGFSRRNMWGMFWSSDDWRFRLFSASNANVYHDNYNWSNGKQAKYSIRCVNN